MNSEEGIYGILHGDSTLLALLYSNTSIYPEAAPQGAQNPCIVYSEPSFYPEDDHDGTSTLDTCSIQIDIYASTVSVRNQISARVRTLLDRYSGTINGIVIQSIQLQPTGFKAVETSEDGKSNRTYRNSLDFNLRQII